MTKASDVRWGRWVGAFAGVVVLIKSVTYVISRLFRLARHEVHARGRDVDFVLDMTKRGKVGGGY